MEETNDFVLGLYRSARELPPDRFHQTLLERVQHRIPFSAAFWCDARAADRVTLVPTALRTRGVDPGFLLDWTRLHHRDPAVPMAISNPGRALRVHVPSFYAQTPDLGELLRGYDIQSMTVLLMPGDRAPAVQAMCLYRPDADALVTDAEKGWLERVMPHVSESLRINRLIHTPREEFDAEGCCVAVVEAATGMLLRADAAFVALLEREWPGFDGRRLPLKLARRWRHEARFTHLARRARIDGRRSGDLVYLTGRAAALGEALTARQTQIAILYAQGLASKQIAQRCELSPATVRSHLATVYTVLGVHGKIEMAKRLGLLLEGGMSRAAEEGGLLRLS